MTNKLLVLMIAAAAGCGVVTKPASATGDDDGSAGSDPEPDGGIPDPGMGSGFDTGSGSGSGSGSGTDIAPGALHGQVIDERGDTIDFSSGSPAHTHAGSTVSLSATGCADVYKYAYLLSSDAPQYGTQNAANPLVWHVAGGATNPSQTSYRIYDAANHVLLDWTPTTPSTGDSYDIELDRDGGHGLAALGTRDGELHIDVRFHDGSGNEIVRSACWNHHPLAAPIRVSAPDVSDVFGMRLPANSPISLVTTTSGAAYESIALTQQTAEPIKIQLQATAPSGTVTKTVVDTYVLGGTASIVGDCADVDCAPAALPTSSEVTTAPLVASWGIKLVDDVTQTTVCSASGLVLACTIPARGINQPPHVYRAVVSVAAILPLVINNQLTTEYTAGAYGSYTGLAPGPATISCDGTHTTLGHTTCLHASSHPHIVALDRITVAFGALSLGLTTFGSSVGVTPSYLASDALAFPAMTWDAGDKGLPLH